MAQPDDYLAKRARHVTEHYLIPIIHKSLPYSSPPLEKLPTFPGYEYPFKKDPKPLSEDSKAAIKVCIIGAGMAGLYIAYILKKLNITDVSFEILEASDRVGGRAFTHHFTNFSQENHQFYEVGAMRFPRNHVMERFFRFCRATSTATIPYYYSTGDKNCPMRFNGINQRKPVVWQNRPFDRPGEAGMGPVDPVATLRAVVQPYIERFQNEDFETAYHHLMQKDRYSVREFLRHEHDKSEEEIQYLEAFGGSSNLFDGAFTEYVLEQLQFSTEDWACIENGTQELADNALRTIGPQAPLKLNQRVKKISLCGEALKVEVTGEKDCLTYDTVFCTTSLGCASRIDLQEANLNWGQKTAIRNLAYSAATKVGMLFSKPWWRTLNPPIDSGGFAQTDELLRICVYPSYNLTDDLNSPAVLLCSYTWTQDAMRLGSIIHKDSPRGEEELKELMLEGLARLHAITYEEIKGYYISHHAHDWYHDPFASGAYASFAPRQFTELYPYLKQPAAHGKLIFAGEATSTYHAWILGALTSAYRAVIAFLCRYNKEEEIIRMAGEFGPFDRHEINEIKWQTLFSFVESIQDQFSSESIQNLMAMLSAPE